jgi:pimeloyl-ACP methyl ester carboxylesterase/tetratricopeptide (TPR) repeat protein
MAAITFLVHGKPAGAESTAAASHEFLKDLPGATVKQSVKVGTVRGSDAGVLLEAEAGKDVVVVHIADGPSLMLHPDNARDLFLAQEGTGASSRDASTAYLQVPPSLGWALPNAPVQKRGVIAKVIVAGIDILTGVSSKSAANVAAGAVVSKVDSQVDPGVYQLQVGALEPLKGGIAKLEKIVAPAAGEALLVLVHGTFSNTEGTFGKLWQLHQPLVAALFKRYGGRVYGLDHPTLGESPISNALLLARTLPHGARLHLLTHSRGGLVAEVLARACSVDTLQQQDLDFFAAQAQDSTDLAELVALVKQEDIRVERIVRVACPARGTLLASKRLDAYLSVLKWTLDAAQIPVLPGLVGFLGDVAQNKSDPEKIPGLAAQMPDSPLVRWLHAAEAPVAGQLRVVAGDVQGDSVGSWIKTLLTDAYYWTDNDFVVQTSSMYGGAPRAGGASFLLDQGGKVSHFTYFSNPGTAQSIVDALTQDQPARFRAIGPLSAAGEDSSGSREPPNLKRPLVFILPGIMGSHLKVDGKRIWLSPGMLNGLDRLSYDAKDSTRVLPDGAVGAAYADLATTLRLTHDVKEFDFDWRKPIETEARRLALAIEKELDLREKTLQPVRLVAHSMGGLVARVMQLERPDVWTRMIARPGARVVMLGTPNGGSWAPMQMLSGDDSFGNALVAFGAPFRDGDARALVASFPGFLQMQAGLLDARLRLDQEETWRKLAEQDAAMVRKNSPWHSAMLQLRSFGWGVPPQAVLDMAVQLRKRLDSQRDSGAFNAKGKVAMVLGRSKFTPDGYTFQHDGLMYLDAPDQGDGRVTLASALLPGVPAWQVDCEHGKLPAYAPAYLGYVELLETGQSALFGRQLDPDAEQKRQADRSQFQANRGARRAPAGPPAIGAGVDADAGRWPDSDEAALPLAISVTNGNLKFVRQPVVLGHYRSSLLTGAEHVMDQLIGGSMSASINMGLYPDAVRTHQIFLNLGEDGDDPLQLPRPESVIVVGLGAEGELTAEALSATVRSGVIGWAQRLAEGHLARLDTFDLAATLAGSGGPGISAAQAARSVAQGVSDANAQLRDSHWPHVAHLHLTELYLDRATDAWRALRLMAKAAPGSYRITDRVLPGTGALRRALDTGYRGATYDMMSAVSESAAGQPDSVITYTLDTKRAREDVRAQRMQGPLIKMLLNSASRGGDCDDQLGKTLFKLLVPPEVEPFMAGTSHMQLSLNDGTAGIPWEMLDTDANQHMADPARQRGRAGIPWAIRVKLLRRLRTIEPPQHLPDAEINGAILVIGEPQCGPDYARLPGAWREARAVADTIRRARPEAEMTELVSPDGGAGFDASHIINTVFQRPWRVVHIAGHGALPSQQCNGGVVLSGGTFLGPAEIATMRVVPALVFVNCCHLGAQDPNALLTGDSDRPSQAANFAQELIKKGVRCVVVAGWAVDDDTAEIFAKTFYAEMVHERFIDAVAAARMAAWMHDKNGMTWAAYQCYGDPDWRWERSADPAAVPPMPLEEEFEGIGSARALALALETVAINARYKDEGSYDCYNKVTYLEDRFTEAWGHVGMVAEAFGLAWSEAREPFKAIEWNRRAVTANDGSATIQALEQLANVLVLAAWEAVCGVLEDTTVRSGDERAATLQEAVRYALGNLAEATQKLKGLIAIQPNVERHSLLASAYKRIAMVHKVAANPVELIKAVAAMQEHYDEAEKIGRAGAAGDWFYPALNKVISQLIAHLHGAGANPFDAAHTGELVRGIEEKIRLAPDFQSVVGRIQLRLYAALANRSLPQEMREIVARFDDLFLRAKAPRYWNSVRDQFDFLLVLCQDVIVGEPLAACQLLHERLAKIAPRPRARLSRIKQPEDATT